MKHHPSESYIQKLIMLEAATRGCILFRQNTGMGWVGEVIEHIRGRLITLRNPRPLHAGLIKGSSDTIGWYSKVITPDMVGQRVAIFTAVEIKTDIGIPSDEQLNFIERVRQAGGIAGVVRTVKDAIALLKGNL